MEVRLKAVMASLWLLHVPPKQGSQGSPRVPPNSSSGQVCTIPSGFVRGYPIRAPKAWPEGLGSPALHATCLCDAETPCNISRNLEHIKLLQLLKGMKGALSSCVCVYAWSS